MLLHDQGAAQRDHHQYAEQPAQHRHQDHPGDLQIEAQDHDRRHGDPDAEGDRLARRTGGLDDVVLQHGGPAAAELLHDPEQGQRDHRHRDRGADRQPDLEHQIERRGPEHDAEQDAEDQGQGSQLAQRGGRRDQRSMRRPQRRPKIDCPQDRLHLSRPANPARPVAQWAPPAGRATAQV